MIEQHTIDGPRLFPGKPYILVVLTLCLCTCMNWSPEAYAQISSPPYTPWMEEETQTTLTQDDLRPRYLTLKDLEKLIPQEREDRPKPENDILREEKPSSPLEAAYTTRIAEDEERIEPLRQYGYTLFETRQKNRNTTDSLPPGLVQDDFILSAGDRIDLLIRGQKNSKKTYTVNPAGQLIIEDFPPVSAAGRTLKDLRADLETQAERLHNTQIYISLSGIRQIGILVAGHVENPGRKTLTAFHTVLDALTEAEGVKKTGTLRRIKLVRKGKSHIIDLYPLLTGQTDTGADRLLQDGDKIIVPPAGPTLAVTGAVKRPGIYEILPSEELTLRQVLGLGGGPLTPGGNRFLKLALNTDGEENIRELGLKSTDGFTDGAILNVAKTKARRTKQITLSGHTTRPGPHDLDKTKTLAALIGGKNVLGPDIYPLIGVIERRDPKDLSRTLLEFSPRQILNGAFDRRLQEDDIIHLFSNTQIRNLEKPDAPLLQDAAYTQDTQTIENELVAAFLRDRTAFIRGAIRLPGAWPVAEGTTLQDILSAAGGTTREAGPGNIEITSRLQERSRQNNNRNGINRITVDLADDDPAAISIGPGDTVRVNEAFHRVTEKSVTLLGEAVRPGAYDLMPGDTLSALIVRAGGLSEQAYPAGAVFSRATERKREVTRYRAQGRDLEMKLAASLSQTDDDKKPDPQQIAAAQTLIAELKDARGVGRITVEADPGALIADPEQDILLEPGDKIYIPQRPLNVRVAGEVLSSAALQFRKGKTPQDYIREAGGTTYYADKDRAFVIYPDGSAQPLGISVWNHTATFIPPGSTIIVPRDPKPFDFLESAERVSQILANLAISGLYIDALGDDD